MTHEEMLKKLGLTDQQFRDLLKKHSDFLNSLDPAQQAVIKRSTPTLAHAAASFGPGASETDVSDMLKRATPPNATAFINVLGKNPP